MTNYYVNITEEEPVSNMNAIALNVNGEKVCIVSESQYQELVQTINEINENIDSHIGGRITTTIESLQNGLYPIPYADNSGGLKKTINETETFISFEQLQSLLALPERITGDEEDIIALTTNLSLLNGEVDGKVNTSTFNSYKTTVTNGLADKADKVHTHNTTDIKNTVSYPNIGVNASTNASPTYQKDINDKLNLLIGELNEWKSLFSWQGGSKSLLGYTSSTDANTRTCWSNLSYNEGLRLCVFNFRAAFDSASAKKYSWTKAQQGQIPEGYRPVNTAIGSMQWSNGTGAVLVGNDGLIGGMFNSAISSRKEVFGTVVWNY